LLRQLLRRDEVREFRAPGAELAPVARELKHRKRSRRVLAPDAGELLSATGEAERKVFQPGVMADQQCTLDAVLDRSHTLEQALRGRRVELAFEPDRRLLDEPWGDQLERLTRAQCR
jgi:hypothetical protein